MQMQHPSSSSQEQGLLEDLFTPNPITHSTWTTLIQNGDLEVFPGSFNEEDDSFLASSSSFLQLISSSLQPTFPNLESFSPLHVSNSWPYEPQMHEYECEYECDDKPRSMVSIQENDKLHEKQQVAVSDNQNLSVFSMGFSGENKSSKSKKVEGQPSKNLMAERRRRKRLNDRLTMLRSIVPRISKMDRTSILGDTIDYMKELLEKISDLKEQNLEMDSDDLNLMGRLNELKVKEAQARNQPKFEVERRNKDTHIQICCSTRPGMLLSTVNTLEALGLDIQQCVISCFNDFTLEASCSEAVENRVMMSSGEIKKILFRNAGYGGRNV